MFGGPGRLYVYFTYGMHFCMNVVSGEVGEGSAVLLRAAEPIDGLDEMRASRGRTSILELCSGPAKLCQAFGVDRSFDGEDLVRGSEIWIAEGTPVARCLDRGRATCRDPRVASTSPGGSSWRATRSSPRARRRR